MLATPHARTKGGGVMSQWQYCQLSNPGSGKDYVLFSHIQGTNLVEEFSSVLGRGLKAENSNPSYLHLNLNYTSSVIVAGLLGMRGWELVSHAVLTGGHEYWTFKQPMPGS
jgi:hypothetical protein